jgi:hypothetical protein
VAILVIALSSYSMLISVFFYMADIEPLWAAILVKLGCLLMNSLIFIGVLAFRKNEISNKNILLVNYSAFIFLLIGLYFAIDFLDAFANA